MKLHGKVGLYMGMGVSSSGLIHGIYGISNESRIVKIIHVGQNCHG